MFSLPISRRTVARLAGGFLVTPFLVQRAIAQMSFPTQPVRYINGFPPGAATDTLSRVFCQKLAELTGQPFIVDNKPGAGGVIGADAVAKSAPDGYTVGLGGVATNVLAIGSYARLPYKVDSDFTFVSGIWQMPNIMVARSDIPTADLKELLALFKKNPGKFTYATGGIGTTVHLVAEMMNTKAGIEVVHVPYKGSSAAIADLLAGRIDILFDNLAGSLPSVRAGSLKAVAVTSKARLPELPDVPAMEEVLPGCSLTSWTMLIGPAKMPAELVTLLNLLTVRALADPAVRAKFLELGAIPWSTTPAEARAFRESEEGRLLPILKAAGIKPQ